VVKTVFVVDSDIGFILWLGRILGDAGVGAIPATNTSEAWGLVTQLKPDIDLVIINPSLDGAADLIQTLRQARGNFKILAVVNDDEEIGTKVQADAVIPRPEIVDGDTGSQVLKTIEYLLAQGAAD
jgi:hypothetical protein